MNERIKAVLKELQPLLARHAGGAEFAGFKNGVVKLRLLGTCKGCALAGLTLKSLIESALKERVKGVTAVEAVE